MSFMRPEQYIEEPPDQADMEYERDANPGEGQQNFRQTQYRIEDDQRVHYDSDTRRREYDFDYKTGRILKLMKRRGRKIRFKSDLDVGEYRSLRQNTLPKSGS